MKYIKIPVPEKKDWKRWFDIAMYKLRGGFKCKSCGGTMPFQHTHIETKVLGKRLMLENHKKNICISCTINELNANAEKVFKTECECDWCGETKETMSYTNMKDPDIFVTFGSRWWNGHYICQGCLNDAMFSPGNYVSSKLYMDGNKTYYVNELGLKVKMK